MLVGSAILTFDISRGDVVEARYPNAPFAISDDELSALAVPEGAHHTQEDHTYIVTQDAAGEPLYGLCCFLNRRDPSAPRGACMKSIVVLSKGPYFSFYLPILRVALNRYMDGLSDAASVLHTLVDRINEVASSRTMDALSLWGASFAVDMPSLPPEHVGGASLLGLVRQFREDTMLLWWAVLLQQRLLFTGQPASAVGACCLAAPLLAAPLRGLLEITSPYVPLAHPAPIEGVGAGGRYICGATNAIFGQKPQWFDALASLGSGTVSGALVDTLRVRVAGSQLRFIKNVLTAVERDGRAEAWVREQFRQHTEAFLLELIMAEEQGRDLKFSCAAISREVWRLTASPGFLGYRASRATSEEPSAALAAAAPQRKRALEYYEMLSAATTASASSGDRSKLLFNLHSTLSDLVDIEALVDAGAVRTLSASHFLQSESGTIRKYATGVLAVLCSTIRGQVAALTAELLPTFVAMLADPMPAVSAAAANALCKSASLFVGAQALVDYGTVPQLMEMLLRPASEELLLRTLIASTLLQLYTHLPSTPRIPNAIPDVASLLLTLAAARELGVVLLQLLDVWGGVSEAVGLHALETTATIGSFVADIPGVAAHVRAISAVGPTQMQSVAALQVRREGERPPLPTPAHTRALPPRFRHASYLAVIPQPYHP